MNSILLLLIEVILLAIAIQDFKTRSVSWLLFPLGYFLCLINSSLYLSYKELAIYVGLNTGIILILILILTLYLVIRHGKAGLKLGSFLGLGDVLFFLLASVCFSPFNFIIFCLISFLTALFIGVILFSKTTTIALAGWQALVLGFVLLFQYFSVIHPFNEYWILKLI